MPLPDTLVCKSSSRGNSLHVLLTTAFTAFVLVLFWHSVIFTMRNHARAPFHLFQFAAFHKGGYTVL